MIYNNDKNKIVYFKKKLKRLRYLYTYTHSIIVHITYTHIHIHIHIHSTRTRIHTVHIHSTRTRIHTVHIHTANMEMTKELKEIIDKMILEILREGRHTRKRPRSHSVQLIRKVKKRRRSNSMV